MTDYGITSQYIETSQTGWIQGLSCGAKSYLIDGHSVSREVWLAYVAEHPELFSDPKWSEEADDEYEQVDALTAATIKRAVRALRKWSET